MVEYIQDLFIEFNEMGFIPSSTCPNPEEYAKEWERRMLFAVNRQKMETIQEIWKDIKDYDVGIKEWITFFKLKYGVREKTEKEKLAQLIIDKVDDMIGGKMIAQALREIYLEEEV